MKKIIFIVGLQKSGTTLINRLVSNIDGVSNPFELEGRHLWGDDPPFRPEKDPCGMLYQKSGGEQGHTLSTEDYSTEHQLLLRKRIKNQNISSNIWVNKNPYHSVRLPWIKKHFPEATIVAMIRNPIANVFSLLKKFHPHESMGFPPDEGWWGVKPNNWKSLVNDNKLTQCAHQWLEINQQIFAHCNLIDHLIKYDDLCKNPRRYLENILSPSQVTDEVVARIGPLTCNDSEYQTGSRLLSKNRDFKDQKNFQLNTQSEPIELAAFNSKEIASINMVCDALWTTLP